MTTETYWLLKSYQKFFKFKTSDFIQFKISGTCSRVTVHKIHERLQNSQQNCEQGHATTAESTMIYVCGMLTNFNDAYIAEIRSELRKLTPLWKKIYKVIKRDDQHFIIIFSVKFLFFS